LAHGWAANKKLCFVWNGSDLYLQKQRCVVVTDHAVSMELASWKIHREIQCWIVPQTFSFYQFQQQTAMALCSCLVAGCMVFVKKEWLEPFQSLVNQVLSCAFNVHLYAFPTTFSFTKVGEVFSHLLVSPESDNVQNSCTAWDEEDGDVSKRILSCPPISCAPFNCPGHELFRKGLAGCGVDTVNAPVGTVFVVAFTVSDLSFPPATSEVVRRILVVSPCNRGQTYCPALAQPPHPTGEFACGTTDCISRAAILALQPVQPPLVTASVEFSKALPVSAISKSSAGSSVMPGPVHGRTATSQSLVCSLLLSHLQTLYISFKPVLLASNINPTCASKCDLSICMLQHLFEHPAILSVPEASIGAALDGSCRPVRREAQKI
jgi:hypothetical protein